MEEIMTIDVTIRGMYEVQGSTRRAAAIYFNAKAHGRFFEGVTTETGVDTQFSDNSGFCLSARYIMTGKDMTGAECSVFIENNGTSLDECRPTIITDSTALSFLETADLISTVTPNYTGVTVKIFCRSPLP